MLRGGEARDLHGVDENAKENGNDVSETESERAIIGDEDENVNLVT